MGGKLKDLKQGGVITQVAMEKKANPNFPAKKIVPQDISTMSKEDQFYENIDANEFGDYSNTTNYGKGTMGDVNSRSRKLIAAGWNEGGGSERGSSSNNAIRLAPVQTSDVASIPTDYKMADQLVSGVLNLARRSGVKSGAELKDRIDEFAAKVIGESDYNKIKSNFMMPNLGKVAAKLYDEKIGSYVPSKERYSINIETGGVSPRMQQVGQAVQQMAEEKKPQTKLRVSNR